MNREEFEREFNSRTLGYLPTYRADNRPVVLRLGDGAHSSNGLLLLVALVNQLARAHQHLVVIDADDAPLLCRPVFGLSTIKEATLGLARAINPFIAASSTPPTDTPLATVTIGPTSEPADLQVGCSGWCATFGPEARIGSDATSRLGAMLASCLTASYAFNCVRRESAAPHASYSLWEFGAPTTIQGPTFGGPVDVGRVLQVGAGGVGGCLDYWLALLGVAGEWVICDGDAVDVSNLNRQLAFLAKDAGYPAPPAANKARAAAALLGDVASADPDIYGETASVAEAEYDVVLALANEHGVRSSLQARQPPVLLHATTSANWEAQFHRHIAGRDDCISCRIPEDGPRLGCATGRVGPEPGNDAALPFLSATAAALLVAGLARLQLGNLAEPQTNLASVDLYRAAATVQTLRQTCTEGCTRWAPPNTRRLIGATTRYASLDPARHS